MIGRLAALGADFNGRREVDNGVGRRHAREQSNNHNEAAALLIRLGATH